MNITRPAWLEIDLDQLEENYKIIKKNLSPGTKILSIVKSDGYKLGAREIVESLIGLGVDYFGVATSSEAIHLREKYSDIGLLILGYTPEFLMEEAIEYNLTLAVYSYDMAIKLNDYGKKLGKKAKIHIVLDTGMNRIGFATHPGKIQETCQEIENINKLEKIEIEGMFSHFAVADMDPAYTKSQYDRYQEVYEGLKERGVFIPMRHISNSHAIMRYREYDMDYVRPGILQYGSREEDPYGGDFPVELIASLKALVAFVKDVPAGEGISYGLTYKTQKPSQIATLPLGYADGLPRDLSNNFEVLVKGRRCRQVGRICMDQCMIDVTGLDVRAGDEVVLLGKQGNEEITIEELAKKTGEIPTSYLTHFTRRLPRQYKRKNKILKVEDLIRKQ